MSAPVVAVLSPGEMGTQVAIRLRELAGARVVTCLAGRSPRSAQGAEQANIEVLPSLDEVLREAHLIISLVTPHGAPAVARAITAAMGRTGARPVLVDGNAIGPATAQEIASIITASGGSFVDGAIIGSAMNLGRATFYLSGKRAIEVAALIEPAVKTEILGDGDSQASGFKILYAGLTKGISALGCELLTGADRLGLLEPMLAKWGKSLPDVTSFFAHNLPDLPPRAARRSQEMEELAATLEGLGLESSMARGAQRELASVAERFAENDEQWQRMLRPLAQDKAPAQTSPHIPQGETFHGSRY
jgi:3-hydroxyisobutyrate dehydrogenase-like beta-hydroxyacid dehydrogenase